jgi:histidine triad (HIT) family protein
MSHDCIFCKIAHGEIPTQLLYQDEEVLAFRDINPQAPVHILIIPVKHVEKVSNVSQKELPLFNKMIAVANQLAKAENIDQKGYRLVFNCGRDAGQEVLHIHLHLLGGRKLNWPPG